MPIDDGIDKQSYYEMALSARRPTPPLRRRTQQGRSSPSPKRLMPLLPPSPLPSVDKMISSRAATTYRHRLFESRPEAVLAKREESLSKIHAGVYIPLNTLRAAGLTNGSVIFDTGASCSLIPYTHRPLDFFPLEVKDLLNSCGTKSHRELGWAYVMIGGQWYAHIFGCPMRDDSADEVFEGRVWIGTDFLVRFGCQLDYGTLSARLSDSAPEWLSTQVLYQVEGPLCPVDDLPPEDEEIEELTVPLTTGSEILLHVPGLRVTSSVMVDSGAMFSTVSKDFAELLLKQGIAVRIVGPKVTMVLASYEKLRLDEWVAFPITIGERTRRHVFQVVPNFTRPISLGCSLIYLYQCVLDFKNFEFMMRRWSHDSSAFLVQSGEF